MCLECSNFDSDGLSSLPPVVVFDLWPLAHRAAATRAQRAVVAVVVRFSAAEISIACALRACGALILSAAYNRVERFPQLSLHWLNPVGFCLYHFDTGFGADAPCTLLVLVSSVLTDTSAPLVVSSHYSEVVMRRAPVSNREARSAVNGRSGRTARMNLRTGMRCGIRM